MNSILGSINTYSGVLRPISLTYFALVQALLIAKGGTGDELPALEPTCTGRDIEREERKVMLMKLVVDMLQSGASIAQVQAFITDCDTGTIPTFAFNGLLTPTGTLTPLGTTGNQTINKPSGAVTMAAAATSITVTNSLVTTNSIVFAVVRTNDTTAIIKNVTPANGSFVIRTTAAVTAATSIGFLVVNPVIPAS